VGAPHRQFEAVRYPLYVAAQRHEPALGRRDRADDRAYYWTTKGRSGIDEVMSDLFAMARDHPLDPNAQGWSTLPSAAASIASSDWNKQTSGAARLGQIVTEHYMRLVSPHARILHDPDAARFSMPDSKTAPSGNHPKDLIESNFSFGVDAPSAFSDLAFIGNECVRERFGDPLTTQRALLVNKRFIRNVLEEAAKTGAGNYRMDFTHAMRFPRPAWKFESWRDAFGIEYSDRVVNVWVDDSGNLDFALTDTMERALLRRLQSQNQYPETRGDTVLTSSRCPGVHPDKERAKLARAMGETAPSVIELGSLLKADAIEQAVRYAIDVLGLTVRDIRPLDTDLATPSPHAVERVTCPEPLLS
jgi:hypothetical protein